jgi:putative membrane protein
MNWAVLLIGLEHLLFAVLEIFFWDRTLGARIYRRQPELAEKTKTLAANQGIYNVILAGGLLISPALPMEPSQWFQMYFLASVVVVGIFGAISLRSWPVLFVQALPAALALGFCCHVST